MKYPKDPYTNEQHIELLRERGLEVSSEDRANRYLTNVGYFRLSGYMFHLQSNDGNHRFEKGVTFDQIIEHYQFDKKLRLLVGEYLERLEVALRSRLTNYYSINYGFYWYTEYGLYADISAYENIQKEIKGRFDEQKERFLKSFKYKYTSESLPPSNMAMEVLTFGKLSRLYSGLKNGEEKQKIAKDFNLPSSILSTWFIYLSNVRNICAHHSRLWNKHITADRPSIPSRKKNKFPGELPKGFESSIYGVIALIDRLLKEINPTNSFTIKVQKLIEDYPGIETFKMGFPPDWKKNAVWKNETYQTEK